MIQPKNWFDNLGEWITRVFEASFRFLTIVAVIAAYGTFFWFAYVVLRAVIAFLGKI
ncbi:MAG: hypothetical protein M1586_00275 [Patescibacteria group bacterium]|nr:hypothetical protein [Patescibacteria group bacterium]MCL5261725.1 hypothetical protein [Patescibacteria group bacterium]